MNETYLMCDLFEETNVYDELENQTKGLPEGKYTLHGMKIGSKRDGEPKIRWDYVISYKVKDSVGNTLAVVAADTVEKMKQEGKIRVTN